MKEFLAGVDRRMSDEEAIKILEKLPNKTIFVIGGHSTASCVAMLHEGVACHGYSSQVDRDYIAVVVPNNASDIVAGNGGVNFRYKNYYYSIRCGNVEIDGDCVRT